MRPSIWAVEDSQLNEPPREVPNKAWEVFIRFVFLVVHDLLGHTAIAITGGALWAYRFHDWASNRYEALSVGCYDRDVMVLEGTTEVVNPLIDVLEASPIAGNYKMTRHEDGTHIRFTVVHKPPSYPHKGVGR